MLNLPKFLVDYKLVIKIKNKLVFLLKIITSRKLEKFYYYSGLKSRFTFSPHDDRRTTGRVSGWEALLVAHIAFDNDHG